MQTALINSALASTPTLQHDDRRYLAPLAACPVLPLTDDEARRGCRVFRLRAELTELGHATYTVCEPVSVWQWLTVGSVLLYTELYQWQDENEPAGQQHYSELATHLGRVVAINGYAQTMTIDAEDGEEVIPVDRLLELWLVSQRTATASTQAN
ncbi:hypothetical protein ACW9KT_10815 [Hymenobacter sp. HD11105]